jgi:hypothetical protein
VKPTEHEPTEYEKAAAVTIDLTRILQDQLPPGIGFAVLMFNIGEAGPCSFLTYGSNAVREDMIKVLRELATKMERDPTVGGG